MNPTPSLPTSAGPPAGDQTAVEFIRGQRQNAAYVFLALAALFLAGTIFLVIKSQRTTPAEGDKPADLKLDEKNPFETPKPDIADPKKGDYTVGWIGAVFGFLVCAAAGVWLKVLPPRPTIEQQRTEARWVLLAVGGLIGFALIAFGGLYTFRWNESLVKGIDQVDWKELKWPVYALFGIVLGSGLVLASVQPARAEERHNLMLRRMVYWSNFGVLVLLMLVGLVVVNVVITKKVPNKLDTTETGFYTLAESTKTFLGKLTESATLYVIMPDAGDRDANDIRQFAYTAQEASDGRLTAKFVSPVTNKQELAALQDKYPRLGRDALGLLVTTGDDGKRSAFISFEDLFETDMRTGRPKGFAGESKVLKELRFLLDNEQRPMVYFTQGHGELSIDTGPGADAAIGGSAAQLKSFLEKGYTDVRPLTFPPQNPTVPDDAAVVIVAEPQAPLSAGAAGALKKYMTEPRKGGSKGKLIVLAGAVAGPDGKVAKTGLEDLLRDFNVQLGDRFVYSAPIQQLPDHRLAIAVFAKAAEQNPIVQTVGKQLQAMSFFLPREVVTTTANPTFQATPLLLTYPGRPTWVEEERIQDPERAIGDLFDSAAIRSRKLFTESPRRVAAVVSESGSGRLIVIGSASVFSDEYATRRSRGGTPATFDLIASGIDWLRDRPPLAATVESKVYKEYQPPEPAAVDTTRLLYLPLGLGLLVVTGLGAGVWVIRRK